MISIQAIAKICHEANRAYCAALGDDSQSSWESAPEWQRVSAIAGVEAIIGGHITKPEDSHISWMDQKREEGWVYGEVKDPATKTHPCMLPYNKLPATQRKKDDIFLAVCRCFLKEAWAEQAS